MTSDEAIISNKLCLKSMNDSLQIFRPIPCLCNKVDDLKRVRKRSLHFSGLRKRRGLCKEDLKKAALCFLIELSVWNRLAKFQSMQLFTLLITQLFNFTKWLHFQQKQHFWSALNFCYLNTATSDAVYSQPDFCNTLRAFNPLTRRGITILPRKGFGFAIPPKRQRGLRHTICYFY